MAAARKIINDPVYGFITIDHPLILEALALLLPQLTPGTEVCVACNRAEAESALDDYPDIELVLLDLALPGTRGRPPERQHRSRTAVPSHRAAEA